MRNLICNTIILIIGTIMLIAMVFLMCGCDQITKCPRSEVEYSVIVFTADWCSSCKSDNKRIEQLKTIADVMLVDVDTTPAMARLYKVQTIPFYIVSQRGGPELLRTNDIETVFAYILGCM